MSGLPLSWCRKDKGISSYDTLRLPLSGITWIPTAEVPRSFSTEELYEDLSTRFPEFIVRGLPHDTARYFMENGAEIVRTGAEAVVDLNMPGGVKQSVAELARRGLRHGSVEEIAYSGFNKEKLRQFVSETARGGEPRLENLYRPGFDKSLRCFVLAAPGERWLGAVTISLRDDTCAHTESILRKKDAPVGVMEALFISVMETLKWEGYSRLSLGEVPFVSDGDAPDLKANYSGGLIFRSKYLFGRSFN